jgi:hypothetical protein
MRGVPEGLPHRGHPSSVGRAGRVLVTCVRRCQAARGAGANVESHQVDRGVRDVDQRGHGGHHGRTVGRQVDSDVLQRVEGGARVRQEVARLGDGSLLLGQCKGQQMALPRPQVVVPVADRVALEQDRRDAGLRPGRGALRVRLRGVRAREPAGNQRDRARPPGGTERFDSARGGDHFPRFATRRREEPEPGSRAGLWLGSGLRAGTGRHEQQRSVREERRRPLALRRARQPAGWTAPGGIQLPERGTQPSSVGGGPGKGHHQAAAVRRAAQIGEAWKSEETVEVE